MRPARTADKTSLHASLTELIRLLLGGGDPLRLAPLIVTETADRYEADISTLFRVENGNRLVLKGGVARLDHEQLLPRDHFYKLDWNAKIVPELAGKGLTVAVAVLNQELTVNSYDELRRLPAHAGRWDQSVYPHGVDDPKTGFGCLYAVPLRLSAQGEPRKTVSGVFKIERRRNRPRFNEIDRAGFDIVADHLGQILRNSDLVNQGVERYVEKVLQKVRRISSRELKQHLEVVTECNQLLQLGHFDATSDSELDAASDSELILERLQRKVPRVGKWIKEICREIRRELGGDPRPIRSLFPVLRGVEITHPSGSSARLSLVRHTSVGLLARVERLKTGLAHLSVSEQYKETALANIRIWLDTFEDYRPQLEWLIDQERWAVLLDSFYRVLPFGTGGRRGPVGIGTNRFNPYTLVSSVQGHVDYLRAHHPDRDLSVVLAYDVREFHDLRRIYNPQLPNPFRGITSRQFAHLAAGVYAANSVRVYMLPENSARYISTPELSFTIRHLKVEGGLNISASHNHPDDNGGKFYNAYGGQEVPPYDAKMARQVEKVKRIATLPLHEAREAGLVASIPAEVHQDYLLMNRAQSLYRDARQAHIVFTPLHGTGDTTVGEVLRSAGFDVTLVPEESAPDGAFPAVPYRTPNPEVPESMFRANELARTVGADVVIATDPDADRIGVCSKTSDGSFHFFTGNEIAVLVTHFKLDSLRRLGQLPTRPLVIKTEVTTELLRAITEDFGGVIIGDLLVGFKYHGYILDQLEKLGRFRKVRASLDDFIIGVEESHGVLVTPEIRDKDAAGAAILLAELAARQRNQGRTLLDYLDDIYRRYGYYANILTSMVMTGAEGFDSIQEIQEGLRKRPPLSMGGWKVVKMVDHQDARGIHGRFLSKTDREARNVLVFHLENNARVIIRPSGTEPKNKTYVELGSKPLGLEADHETLFRQKAELSDAAQNIAHDFTHQMLAMIGVELPDFALRVSGLVPLDKRITFVRDFLPALEVRARQLCDNPTSREEISNWIDEHLQAYGADARGLVAEAVRAYVDSERTNAQGLGLSAAHERVRCLDAMEAVFFRH